MLIGLTYDLKEEYLQRGLTEAQAAEFDPPETIEALQSALRSLGHETDCIGSIRSLTMRLAAGQRWDLVFNIAEGLCGLARESQVPCLLEAFEIPYTFSDAFVLALALHKGMAKLAMRAAGVPTPDFAVLESDEDAERVSLPFPLFAKPVAEGTGKGISAASKISSRADLVDLCRRLRTTYRQPVLVERFLPGRELTVGIIGTGPQARAWGVMEVMLRPEAEPDAYSYSNKAHYEKCVDYRLIEDRTASSAAAIALRAWKALGCRDGGRVDLRCDANGTVHFLELNPLAGLNPRHSDLVILCRLAGISYRQLIESILASALQRIRS